jgi:hypothetical protein
MVVCGLLLWLRPWLWLVVSALCVVATNSLLPGSGQPGSWWMAVLLAPGVSYPSLVPAFAMAGVGMGLTFAPSATAVLADMREEDHATASSANATLRETGVALGVAVLTAVFLGAGGSLTPTGYTDALAPALLVGAAFVAVAVVAALLMPGRVPTPVVQLSGDHRNS